MAKTLNEIRNELETKEVSDYQRKFLSKILVSGLLSNFEGEKTWYDFNDTATLDFEGYHRWYIPRLQKAGEWWRVDITERIRKIVIKGKYNFAEQLMLNSVSTYIRNKKEIDEINEISKRKN